MNTKIILNTTADAEEFVNAASMCPGEIDLASGSVYIDGKSLLGVISMGVKRELTLTAYNVNEHFEKVVNKFSIA